MNFFNNWYVFEILLNEAPKLSSSVDNWHIASVAVLFSLLALSLILLVYRVVVLQRADRKKTIGLAEQLSLLTAQTRENSILTARLQSTFESSIHGISAFESICDSHGEICDFRFVMINKIGAQIVGKDVADIIGRTMMELVPGNFESGLFESYKQVVISGKSYQTYIYYNHDNISLWLSISAVKSDNGLVITFSDMSEIKNKEQELIKNEENLRSVNAELEQFAYIASHDLQEPLRKIKAFGDRLQSQFSPILGDKGSDYINRMQSASARMQTLIDDLLTYSRATKGKEDIQNVDLNEVVAVVEDLLSESISANHATINCAQLPTIECNASQITQLFLNIISNAIKYAKKDLAPKIDIWAEDAVISDDGVNKPFCKILIQDNGIGFDDEHSEKIFEIFRRLHGRSEYDGTGIGLAISHKIVSNHNGFIYAKGEPGVGALFTVELPR